jgi:YbgC/YbaW family acyl-CoA thioester hydrolase
MNLYARLLWLLTRRHRRPTLTIWDTVRTPFRVWPNDLDFNGHMNNGRYLTLLDLGRIDMMTRSNTWKKAMDAGWYPVVAAQEITYKRSLKPFQKFEIATTMHGHDGRNVLVKQDFMVGDDVYATAMVKARWLHRTGGSVTIEELTEVTGQFPETFTLVEAARTNA